MAEPAAAPGMSMGRIVVVQITAFVLVFGLCLWLVFGVFELHNPRSVVVRTAPAQVRTPVTFTPYPPAPPATKSPVTSHSESSGLLTARAVTLELFAAEQAAIAQRVPADPSAPPARRGPELLPFPVPASARARRVPLSERSAHVVFVHQDNNYELFGLLQSVMHTPVALTPHDVVVAHPPQLHLRLPPFCLPLEEWEENHAALRCIVVAVEDVANKRREYQQYGFINSIWAAAAPETAFVAQYRWVLRADQDTFAGPLLHQLIERGIPGGGRGEYDFAPETREHLKQVVRHLGLRDQGWRNICSLFGPGRFVRDVSTLAMVVTRHMLAHSYVWEADGQGTWPQWWRGVTSMYANEIALNELADGTFVHTTKVDYKADRNERACVAHIHPFQAAGTMFNKWDWNGGKYDKVHVNDVTSVPNFAVKMARRGRAAARANELKYDPALAKEVADLVAQCPPLKL